MGLPGHPGPHRTAENKGRARGVALTLGGKGDGTSHWDGEHPRGQCNERIVEGALDLAFPGHM